MPEMKEVLSEVLEQDNKFMTIRADTCNVTVLKIQWYKKPVIEIGITATDKLGDDNTFELLLVDKSKITQLLGLIGVKISDFYRNMGTAIRSGAEEVFIEDVLQKAIDEHIDDIHFKCSWYESEHTGEGNWYAFAVTTDRHVIVPHKIIENKIKTRFKGFRIDREVMHYTPVWHVRLRTWKQGGDEFTAFVVISGGRNVKKGRIKVIPLVKIGSCDNTIRPVEYIEINHTKGWEKRFDDALTDAHQMLTEVRELIRLSRSKDMTYEQIEAEVKSQISDLKIRKNNHILVEKAVMNRVSQIQKEKETLTLWDMSQALTYVGSFPDEVGVDDVVTDHAQIQLQTSAYKTILKEIKGEADE